MSEETSTYMFGIYDLFPGQKLEGWPADKVFSTEMTDAGERDKAGQGAEDPVVRSVMSSLTQTWCPLAIAAGSGSRTTPRKPGLRRGSRSAAYSIALRVGEIRGH